MKLKAALSWTFVSVIVRYVVKLVGNLTLARLLTPEDFGLTAIVLAVVSGLEAITDVGTGAALIRAHRSDDDWVDTAWTLAVVRGSSIGLSLVIAAIPVAAFFHEPRLAPMIAVAGTTSIMLGLSNISSVTALRDLQLKQYAILEIAASVGGYVVMLAWAWLSPSAWALLSGAIVTTGIFAGGSHFAFGYRPSRFRWNRQAVAELTGFGKWVFLASLVGFFIFQGDKFGVAKLVSVTAAGLYAIASTWALSLQSVFGIFLSQLYLPVSAKVWRRYGSGSPEFLALRRSVLWIMIVPYATVAGCSNDIIAYLYPHIYLGAGPLLAILVIGGWFGTMEYLYNDQLMVAGEPRWRFYAQITSLGVVGIALLIFGRGISSELIAIIFSAGAFVRGAWLICACDRRDPAHMIPDLLLTGGFVALAFAIKGAAFELSAHASPFAVLVVAAVLAGPPAAYLTFRAMRRIFRLTDGVIAGQPEGQLAMEGAAG